MEIKNFNNIRCGSEWPIVIDVAKISDHDCYGVMATAWTHRDEKETGYVQIRIHSIIKCVALFSFKYNDTELPEEWEDSAIIWDSRTDK